MRRERNVESQGILIKNYKKVSTLADILSGISGNSCLDRIWTTLR